MTHTNGNGQLFLTIFDCSAVGTVLICPDGNIVKANRAFSAGFGYTEQELLNQPITKLLVREGHASWAVLLMKLLEEDMPTFETEGRLLHKDGRHLWARLHAALIRGEEGGPVYITVQMMDITENKRHEQRYHSLIANNQAAVCSVDMSHVITSANPVMEQVTGYRENELIGMPLDALMFPFCINHPAETHFCGQSVILVQSRSGDVIELGMKKVPIMVDGQLEGYYMIGRDVGEHNRTQEALRESKRELEDVVRNVQGMIFKFKRVDGRFIHTLCDGELMHKVGLRQDKVVGAELKDFLPAGTAVVKEAYYERAWRGEPQVQYEGEYNGVTYLACLNPIRRDGQVVEVLASCIDISVRKRMEVELKETKELLESLFDNISDAIEIVDVEGRVMRINSAFQQIYQWSEEEIVGKPLPASHNPDQLRALLEELSEGRRICNYEKVRRKRNGEDIDVSITMSPLKDSIGRIFAYAGISRDITEKKKTEDFLNKLDKLNVVGQLAAGLAHEIRNPLTSLRGFLQLMQNGLKEKDMYFDIMLEELDRINTIITEFLFIAKPKVQELEREDPLDVLAGVLKLLEPEAHIYNIQFLFHSDPGIPLVLCSESQLKQVFINIVKNAIEAMPDGGMLDISISFLNGKIMIKFVDQGIGIDQDRLPKLGEPFYTTKEKGTGLGLMMCYKIIEAHHGSITITSRVKAGTTIHIVLPAVE